METEAAPKDEKAKRTRDLLSSFYAPGPSISNSGSSISTSFDNINSTSFDADQYMDLMVSLVSCFFFSSRRKLVDSNTNLISLLSIIEFHSDHATFSGGFC